MHVVYQILKQCAAGWQTNQSESNIVRPGWMCSAPRKKKDLAGAERDGGVGLGVWWRGRGGVEASGGPGWGGSITACQIRRLGTALPCHHALWSWRRVSRSFCRTLHGRGELKEPTFFICLFIFISFSGGRGLSYNVCTVLNKNYKLHWTVSCVRIKWIVESELSPNLMCGGSDGIFWLIRIICQPRKSQLFTAGTHCARSCTSLHFVRRSAKSAGQPRCVRTAAIKRGISYLYRQRESFKDV